MVGTTITRCVVGGCSFATFSNQPGLALTKHFQQSHPTAGDRGSMQMQQSAGLREKLRLATAESDALREHLEKFHICSDLCKGERP